MADFITLPLVLVLENVETDGAWLRMLVGKLRPSLKRYFDATPPHIELYNAGGIGEIPKSLNRLFTVRDRVAPVAASPRVMAMADSDARKPGSPADGAVEVSSTARKLGVDHHVLAKRTIENYIPDAAVRAYGDKRADRRGAAAVIVSLDAEARDHYPMKNGLSERELAESTLYPTEMKAGLGLGDFITDLLENFYHEIKSNDLNYRDGKSELTQLLDTLEGNL